MQLRMAKPTYQKKTCTDKRIKKEMPKCDSIQLEINSNSQNGSLLQEILVIFFEILQRIGADWA